VRLLTAHRILIGTAVVFFLGLALWELKRAGVEGDPWGFARAVSYLAAAVGFAFYLKSLKSWIK